MFIGCCAYSYRPYFQEKKLNLEQFIDLASDMGLDGVELTAYFFASTDAGYLDRVKERALRKGVHIAGTAVGNRFTLPDEHARAEQIALVKQWVDNSVRLGAPYVRVFAGPVPEGTTEEQAFEWVVAALKECGEYAGERGIFLALENHGGITARAEQVLRIVDAVGMPSVAVNLDTGNYRVDPYEDIARTVPAAITCHVKPDIKVDGKLTPVDLRAVLTTLHKSDYRGYLNIEYESEGDPMTEVPALVDELRSILRDLGHPRYTPAAK